MIPIKDKYKFLVYYVIEIRFSVQWLCKQHEISSNGLFIFLIAIYWVGYNSLNDINTWTYISKLGYRRHRANTA